MMPGQSCRARQVNSSPAKKKQCERHRSEGAGEVQHREERRGRSAAGSSSLWGGLDHRKAEIHCWKFLQ